MEPLWNSQILETAYTVCGWASFFLWCFCLYPQIFLNFRRKSVVGLSMSSALINGTKHIVYFIYNTGLYFSPVVQSQYHEKYGFDQMIPVAANDVAFSFHSVAVALIILYQIAIYDRGNQTFNKYAVLLVCAVGLGVGACFFVASPTQSWLWFLSILSSIQGCMAIIQYTPQAIMNCLRKSTEGFSIGYVLLDFSGGILNYAQMMMQSIDQNSWVNLEANTGKVLLALVVVFFDLIFMCQHYCLYPNRKVSNTSKLDDEITEPLVTPMLDEEITRVNKKFPNKSTIENV